jgi:hypothetical protein
MPSLLRSSKLAVGLALAMLAPALADVYPPYQPVLMYVTRAPLVLGAYTYTFPTAFVSTPACVATGESSLVNLLDVTPSTTSCIVTSSSGIDTQTVDIIVVGNPN